MSGARSRDAAGSRRPVADPKPLASESVSSGDTDTGVLKVAVDDKRAATGHHSSLNLDGTPGRVEQGEDLPQPWSDHQPSAVMRKVETNMK